LSQNAFGRPVKYQNSIAVGAIGHHINPPLVEQRLTIGIAIHRNQQQQNNCG
jgi:hypothetical protein